ncbi:hypothetical protein [Goodfellowiella coeruleoviolacea]|uniref:Uncharacterized protein n=1 Tax=Goodfellowiella coeruleoviolacea TaxID=334858 RepID=A0AAE3KKU1_9PSEU|nr:hypothetical protein [Goodfellowiella coeruleoviolacea]MCP2165788.1 hypothetical protein [Goodfellowiella coeruleoviolacea]
MTAKYLDRDDAIIETELAKYWLQPGERLLLGTMPLNGYVGARIDSELHIPYQSATELPAHALGRCRWPLPSEALRETPRLDEDWVEDPTLAYWVDAPHPNTDAVRMADHFAHTRGTARLVLSDQRTAVIYPARLFDPKDFQPAEPMRTFYELPPSRVAGLSAPFVGRSIPPRRVIRLDFTDGSTIMLRDPHSGGRVDRALRRLSGQQRD